MLSEFFGGPLDGKTLDVPDYMMDYHHPIPPVLSYTDLAVPSDIVQESQLRVHRYLRNSSKGFMYVGERTT